LSCFEAPGDGADSDDADDTLAPASSSPAAWYCDARQWLLNTSAVSLGSSDLAVPTAAQKGTWAPRALLFDCALDWRALRKPRRFGMLLRQLLPAAAAELPVPVAPATARDDVATHAAQLATAAAADRPGAAPSAGSDDAAPVVVFVARYSVSRAASSVE
jgi:hypothetical protein